MADIVTNAPDLSTAPLARVYWAVNATEADSASESAVKAAVTGKSLYLTKMLINCAVAHTVELLDASTTLLGPFTFLAAGQTVISLDFKTPIKLTVSQALNVTAGGAYALYVEGFTA